MFFKDEVTDVLPLDRQHRMKWFNATGLLMGLNAEEIEKTLEIFNELLDNWEQYKKYHDIYEYMLPMVRRAINYLYSEDGIIWSIKMDKKRLYVYRHNFSLPDYVEHFDRLYKSSIKNIRDNFKNIDAEAEVRHLCIRDYFYHLSNVSKTEDYESIIRDTKLTKLIEE
jgi:hypothetical protein